MRSIDIKYHAPRITTRINETITVSCNNKKYKSKVTSVVKKTGLIEAVCGNINFLCTGSISTGGVYYGQIIK